jgi:hypothetical protein
VKVSGGLRETELRQCGACTAVFKEPSLFARAPEFRLTAPSAAALAQLDATAAVTGVGGSKTPWHWSNERPLNDADVGRFVVGVGYSGWIGGVVVKTHGLAIDSAYGGGSHGQRLVAANAVQFYLILDPPPPVR